MKVEQDSPGVGFPPPLAFAGTLVAGLAMGGWGIPLGSKLEHLLGWLALVAGGSILLTAIGLFRRAGTNPQPWKSTSRIVTTGVYRWTRNPMYLSMALIYVGIALLNDSAVCLVLLVPLLFVIQRQVIEREEAYLEARFGRPYLDYKASARRWF